MRGKYLAGCQLARRLLISKDCHISLWLTCHGNWPRVVTIKRQWSIQKNGVRVSYLVSFLFGVVLANGMVWSGHIVSWIWMNIGSGKGQRPDGIKAFPDPMSMSCFPRNQRVSTYFPSSVLLFGWVGCGGVGWGCLVLSWSCHSTSWWSEDGNLRRILVVIRRWKAKGHTNALHIRFNEIFNQNWSFSSRLMHFICIMITLFKPHCVNKTEIVWVAVKTPSFLCV